jgi:16S rRNA (adenine1518-N6/adenine1519-N6)-dimethyltransferase
MKDLLASDFLAAPLNPTHPSEIAMLLKNSGFKPSKHLGQNFLVDLNILATIIEAAGLEQKDIVLEIGAGLGALTLPIAERVLKIITIEKDKRLADFLSKQLADFKNIILIENDAMRLDIFNLIKQYKINKLVANFPYSIASSFLMELFKQGITMDRMVATLQREVASRILSRPGTSDYGLLSIWAQLNYEVEKVKEISPTSFFPPPDVQSTIICFTPRTGSRMAENSQIRQLLFKITKSAFTNRRKQIKNTINFIPPALLAESLKYAGIPLEARPESICIAKWNKLAQHISSQSASNSEINLSASNQKV